MRTINVCFGLPKYGIDMVSTGLEPHGRDFVQVWGYKFITRFYIHVKRKIASVKHLFQSPSSDKLIARSGLQMLLLTPINGMEVGVE